MTWTREATIDEVCTVVAWLKERGGEELAKLWLLECTPVPCGRPSIEQAEEGLAIAAGELRIGEVLDRTYAEMARLSERGE